MNIKRFNWQTWAGFLLSIFAFLSYFFIFVWFPITRDFPWANLLLFVCAIALLLFGLRRAFAKERSLRSKITASIVSTLGVLVCAMFLFSYFVAGRWLPESRGAPQVGQKAPDFTLTDTKNKQVSLAELLSAPINGQAPKGVLLVFYRGYW
ncbi:MAG TPA: hypothetical protein VGQ39_13815 [Pyrinomonadaceae bacterium]|jgi:hypothetical protein|nr:hypothetical protein [Pyrinomonadaceae bacterium]